MTPRNSRLKIFQEDMKNFYDAIPLNVSEGLTVVSSPINPSVIPSLTSLMLEMNEDNMCYGEE
jgi:hypothetical protein